MAGRILSQNGKLYRFGQNNNYGYGAKLVLNEILVLSRTHYEERKVTDIQFTDAMGPHTIDIYKGKAVMDFYQDRFSLLAGYRRMIAKYLK